MPASRAGSLNAHRSGIPVPERWGEGIGGAILDAVLAGAKRGGYSRIHLWTHDDNERSHRRYRSRGFSPTGRTADGEGNGYAIVDRGEFGPVPSLGRRRFVGSAVSSFEDAPVQTMDGHRIRIRRDLLALPAGRAGAGQEPVQHGAAGVGQPGLAGWGDQAWQQP